MRRRPPARPWRGARRPPLSDAELDRLADGLTARLDRGGARRKLAIALGVTVLSGAATLAARAVIPAADATVRLPAGTGVGRIAVNAAGTVAARARGGDVTIDRGPGAPAGNHAVLLRVPVGGTACAALARATGGRCDDPPASAVPATSVEVHSVDLLDVTLHAPGAAAAVLQGATPRAVALAVDAPLTTVRVACVEPTQDIALRLSGAARRPLPAACWDKHPRELWLRLVLRGTAPDVAIAAPIALTAELPGTRATVDAREAVVAVRGHETAVQRPDAVPIALRAPHEGTTFRLSGGTAEPRIELKGHAARVTVPDAGQLVPRLSARVKDAGLLVLGAVLGLLLTAISDVYTQGRR